MFPRQTVPYSSSSLSNDIEPSRVNPAEDPVAIRKVLRLIPEKLALKSTVDVCVSLTSQAKLISTPAVIFRVDVVSEFLTLVVSPVSKTVCLDKGLTLA